MKNLNSNYMNEMPEKDMIEVNGGGMAGPRASSYMTQKQIKALGQLFEDGADCVWGFIRGISGCKN